MIKTDKVIYRTRTQEEYDWLMEKLEEAGCMWVTEKKPTELNIFNRHGSDTCIVVKNKGLFFIEDGDFDDFEMLLEGFERVEVSELMENEEKTITDEPSEQEDKPKKIKKIVYTTEVYFE